MYVFHTSLVVMTCSSKSDLGLTSGRLQVEYMPVRVFDRAPFQVSFLRWDDAVNSVLAMWVWMPQQMSTFQDYGEQPKM
jgi:hypothetical protein